MKFLLKCLFTCSVVFFSSLLASSNVFANDATEKVNKESLISIQSTDFIRNSSNSIYLRGTRSLRGTCFTSSYRSVYNISCELTLQIKNKSTGNWQNHGDTYRFKKYFATNVNGSANFNVKKGNYYRIKTMHKVNQSGVIEKATSYTGMKYIP